MPQTGVAVAAQQTPDSVRGMTMIDGKGQALLTAVRLPLVPPFTDPAATVLLYPHAAVIVGGSVVVFLDVARPSLVLDNPRVLLFVPVAPNPRTVSAISTEIRTVRGAPVAGK